MKLIPICTHFADYRDSSANAARADAARPLTAADRQAIVALLEKLNREGLRVLAVAYKDFRSVQEAQAVDNKAETGLTLCGLLTFLDPPKPDTREVLQRMAALNVKSESAHWYNA